MSALPAGAARDEMSHRINFLDPPDHTRVRRLVSKTFTPRRVAALVPWIERTAAELLDGIDPREPGTGVPGRREDSENQKSSLVGIACRLRSNLRSSGEGRVRERRSRQGAKRTRLSARGDAQGQCHGRGGEAGFAKREKCERCASADDVASLATAAPFGNGQATRRGDPVG